MLDVLLEAGFGLWPSIYRDTGSRRVVRESSQQIRFSLAQRGETDSTENCYALSGL